MSLPKIIVVCGPTASGKSDKAVELALLHNGEVISADSRQVYRGLDIGSGKITPEEMKGVTHHLLDVADPKEIFSVEDFIRLGEKAIQDILERDKLPIICGGTGFYIDALIYGSQFPEVAPNVELRAELEKVSLEDLQKKLEELDPERYESIDIYNPVRLVRAIEIATALGKVPPVIKEKKYDVEFVYLDFPKEILTQRITQRLYKRLEQGVLEEAERLHTEGVLYERMKQLGLEYRYMAMCLLGEITYQEMCDFIILRSTQYAKKQRLWFKRYLNLQ
jgi:tRNA dimethylallyltransferase